MISKLKGPVYVQVELTSDCNNSCIYCYNFWRNNQPRQRRSSLSMPDLERVAKILGEIGVFYVTITGGEPFLKRKEIYRFMDCLRAQNIRIMINSNAMCITGQEARRLSLYPVEIFLASLSSWNPEQHNAIVQSKNANAHKRAVEGIQHLQKYKIPVAVNMVATKLNYQEVYRTGKWLYESLHIDDFSATPICPSLPEHCVLELDKIEIRAVVSQLAKLRREMNMRVDILEVLPVCLFSDDDSELSEILSARMCTAGNTTITIGSEGDVRVCSYDGSSYGNILRDDFPDIWNKMSEWRDDSLTPQECKNCNILETCGGGCRVSSKIRTDQYCKLNDAAKNIISNKKLKSQHNEVTLSPDIELKAVRSISFREEKDDIFLAVANPMHFVLTNNDGLRLLQYLVDLPNFTPQIVANNLGIDLVSLLPLLSELYQKRFLVSV